MEILVAVIAVVHIYNQCKTYKDVSYSQEVFLNQFNIFNMYNIILFNLHQYQHMDLQFYLKLHLLLNHKLLLLHHNREYTLLLNLHNLIHLILPLLRLQDQLNIRDYSTRRNLNKKKRKNNLIKMCQFHITFT